MMYPRQQRAIDAEKAAKDLGLVMFTRPANVLMLDMDVPRGTAEMVLRQQIPRLFPDHQGLADRVLDAPTTLFTVSKSGNTHVYLRLPAACTDREAIAIQLFFGSDPEREALSLETCVGWRWQTAPTVLFETPAEAERVKAWLEAK